MAQKNPFKSDEIYGFQTLHREIGYYISRLEDYDKALKFFDEAIKKTPMDIRALIGRARVRSKVTQYEGALQDNEKVLKLDSEDLVVLADKALNMYLCCEFEESLVENSRLFPKRQKPDNFQIGVMQCCDAIENCVGDRTGRPLRDHFEKIRKLAWKKVRDTNKPPIPKASKKTKKKSPLLKQLGESDFGYDSINPRLLKMKSKHGIAESSELEIKDSLHSRQDKDAPIPNLLERFPFKPLQNYTTNIKNYMAEKYLDSMYLDKIFLENIKTASGRECPNRKGSLKIKELASNCYKTISYKQELLRTRRPFYFIKYQEAKVSGTLQKRQKLELEHQQRTIKKEADAILSKMLGAYADKKLKQCLDLIEKLKRFCDSNPKKFIPDKSIYMNQIYVTVCKAFYDVYRLNKSHGILQQGRRIYCLLGAAIEREVSVDSVIEEFKGFFLNYQKEINEFKGRLEKAILPEEICWYYHELSRYHLETKQYDLSRLYAKKCIQTATKIQNYYWVFNSTMIIVKSNVLQQNKNDAKNELAKAMKCATLLGDEDKIEFLTACLDILDSIALGDASGLKELEKREKKIVQMMASSHMKEEVTHLFRQMAAMPPSRRMTVIPGVKTNTTSGSRTTRAMSIMPTNIPEFSFDKGKLDKKSKPDQREMVFKDFLSDQ